MADGLRGRADKAIESGSIAVFDLGGTWFRRGVYDNESGTLRHVERQPAISFRNQPGSSVEDLQLGLLHYLRSEIERLDRLADRPISHAGVAIGAAVNAHDGEVLGSGPLWGAKSRPFQLRAAAARETPAISWHVVNDVTAALLRLLSAEEVNGEDVALITISTGIAARWARGVDRSIETDPVCGLQGEIGHVPVSFVFRGRRRELACDCGGLNHLNAFASGRGLQKVLSALLAELRIPCSRSVADMCSLPITLRDEILSAVTEPLAQTILIMLATKPALRRLYLTGGVIHGTLGRAYLAALMTHLRRSKAYLASDVRPRFFDELIRVAPDDDLSGLIGAALAIPQTGARARAA